jgi:3-phosphoshikimate 1-carboxyvinyltransferase
LRIARSGPLRGTAKLAGDLQIGQQALVWAALASGSCRIHNLGARGDHVLLAAALRELGVAIEQSDDGYLVEGRGIAGLSMPRGVLRAGDSASTLELVVALLAGQRFGTRVEVAEGLRSHSLRTLVLPLRERGANVAGKRGEDGDIHPPVAVAPLLADEWLGDAEIAIPSGDPITKLGLLLSGLYARGVTAVSEGMLSRDHAERALMALGAPIQTAAGMTLLDTTEPPAGWSGFAWTVPGDFTLASFVLAAAITVDGSDVRLDGVGLNPTRTALLDALRGTGARVAVQPKGDAAGNEPLGDLRVQSSRLSRLQVGGERAFGLLDEVPALLALCSAVRDRMSVRDVGVLRNRNPDGLAAGVELLRRFGVACTTYQDGIEIDPPERLVGAHLERDVAPLQALLGCILGLRAEGETQIDGSERLDALYPGVVDTLIALGARIEREETA